MAEPLAWNDPLLEACEGASCPCGHEAIDHAWHGCDECACQWSGIRALLESGQVEVRVIAPAEDTP